MTIVTPSAQQNTVPLSWKWWVGWGLVCSILATFLLVMLWPPLHSYDHFFYLHFSEQYLPAKDGNSALWYDLFRLTSHHLSVGILLPISLILSGLFLLGYWVIQECHQRLIPSRDTIILLATLLSLGCWYFVSGRVYSDFPPTIFTFSLALLALQKAQSKHPNTPWWPIHFILLGLTTSWKTHNVFLVGPTLLFTASLFITTSHRSWYRSLLILGGSLLLGLFGGFYQFFSHPFQTLQGIRGYSNDMDFDYLRWLYVWTPQPFFHRVVSDHIFLPPITLSALPFPFLITLLVGAWRFARPIFWVSGCSLLAFSVFILCLIPGYPWHGFPISIGLYICLLFVVVARRQTPHYEPVMRSIKWGTLGSALIVFGWYIPTQIAIVDGTRRAMSRLNQHASTIWSVLHHYQASPSGENTLVLFFRYHADGRIPLLHHDARFNSFKWNQQHHYQCPTQPHFIVITPSFSPLIGSTLSHRFWAQYEHMVINWYKAPTLHYKQSVLFQNSDIKIMAYHAH